MEATAKVKHGKNTVRRARTGPDANRALDHNAAETGARGVALIRRHGFANFRVASVAKEAGVSAGGQLHHFPTKDLMTLAVIDHAIAIAQERSAVRVAACDDVCDAVAELIADCRDYYFSASFDVAMDVTKGASGNPELRRAIARKHRDFRAGVENAWLAILIARGWLAEDARDGIALIASVIRGFAIRAMIRPDTDEVERLVQRFRRMVDATFGPAAGNTIPRVDTARTVRTAVPGPALVRPARKGSA